MKVHSDIRSCLIPLQSFARLYYQAPLVVGKCTNHLAFSSTKSGPNVWTIRTLCEPNYTRWIVAWLRPNVASAPWKVFAMWIRLVLTWHINVYPGFLAPSLPSHVCRLNCLNIEAWKLISSFGIKHLGANNAIPRRHQQKCRWHQKKHDQNTRTYAQPTLHTRKECLVKAHYHNIHGHSLKGVVSSESGHGVSVCVLAQRSPQTNVLTVTTMERQSKHVCASATCQVAKSRIRSKMCEKHLVWSLAATCLLWLQMNEAVEFKWLAKTRLTLQKS